MAVDVPALADQRREFDYLVPSDLDDRVTVGTMVRVPLHGRRVGGWVVADQVEPAPGIRLQTISRVTGYGPAPDLVDLTAWAAWRWAGRRTALLRAASPLTAVRTIPTPPPSALRPHAGPVGPDRDRDEAAGLARDALAAGEAVVRLAPASDPLPLLQALAAPAPILVVCASVDQARDVSRGLGRMGVAATTVPEGWARGAGGGITVVGARAASWAPAFGAAALVVLDAHDRALAEERAPTWNAWVVAAERARRAGVPCILVSPCPALEQLSWGQLIVQSRASERAGWAPLEVVDRTAEDPRAGLLSERLVPALRAATGDRRVVCILNRKGRIRLLACRACGRLATCEHCGGAMEQPGRSGAELRCRRCARERPRLCQACGSTALRTASSGVTKVRDDVEALSLLPAGEVTADTTVLPGTPVIVGTEAALYRLDDRVGAVVFLDFDAELLAPRYRAAEDALALLARAARLVHGRRRGGRVFVQTRQPRHEVIEAALRGDPSGVAAAERAVRSELDLPPFSALAELSGDADATAAFAERVGAHLGVEALGPTGGRWLLRAADHRTLCDALAATGRPPGTDGTKLRIEMDPLRA